MGAIGQINDSNTGEYNMNSGPQSAGKLNITDKPKAIETAMMDILSRSTAMSQVDLTKEIQRANPNLANVEQTEVKRVVDRLSNRGQIMIFTGKWFEGKLHLVPRTPGDRGPGKYVSLPISMRGPLNPDFSAIVRYQSPIQSNRPIQSNEEIEKNQRRRPKRLSSIVIINVSEHPFWSVNL